MDPNWRINNLYLNPEDAPEPEPAPEPRTSVPKDASYNMSFNVDPHSYGEREFERRRVEAAQQRALYACKDDQREQKWKLEETNRKALSQMRKEDRDKDLAEFDAIAAGMAGVLKSKTARPQAEGYEDYLAKQDIDDAKKMAMRKRELALLEQEFDASQARLISTVKNRREADAVFREQSRREHEAERRARIQEQEQEDAREAELQRIHQLAAREFAAQTAKDLASFEEKRAKAEMYRKMGVSNGRSHEQSKKLAAGIGHRDRVQPSSPQAKSPYDDFLDF